MADVTQQRAIGQLRSAQNRGQEQRQGGFQRIPVGLRVVPARVQFPAQLGQLALGQLAGGEDGAVAEFVSGQRAVQVFLGLPITHGADRRQVQRPLDRPQLRQRAPAFDFMQETGFEHRVEA